MIRLMTAFVGLVFCAINAHAGLMYDLSFSKSNVSLNAGESITLGIIFSETATDGSIHRLGLNPGEGGLISANFAIERSGSGGNLLTAASGETSFANSTASVGDPITSIVQSVDFLDDPVFATLETLVGGVSVRSVQIATVTFTGSGLLGEVNLFSLKDFNPSPTVDDFVIEYVEDQSFDSFVADRIMTFGSVTVSTVPEPASIVSLGVIGLIGCLRSRRKSLAAQSLIP